MGTDSESFRPHFLPQCLLTLSFSGTFHIGILIRKSIAKICLTLKGNFYYSYLLFKMRWLISLFVLVFMLVLFFEMSLTTIKPKYL